MNYKKIDSVAINSHITYKEFYSENLFDKIKKSVNYKGEWSVASRFHPAILQYNQIRTLDGYLSYYPLKYKKEFRKLIEPQLNNNEFSLKYFDGWGGRAYFFSDNNAYKYIKTNKENKKEALLINIDIFKQLEGKYIFSRFIISNADELKMKLIDKFEDVVK